MNARVQRGFPSGVVAAALEQIPAALLSRVPFDLHLGVDPVFSGLLLAERGNEATPYLDGSPSDFRARDCAMCIFPWGEGLRGDQRRPPVIALPPNFEARYGTHARPTVVHEYGHAVDLALGLCVSLPALSSYALTHRQEAFAVAFEYFLDPVWHDRAREELGADSEVLELICSGRWEFRL